MVPARPLNSPAHHNPHRVLARRPPLHFWLGTARASVFAPAHYSPQRLSDLFCRHKLSGQALIAHLAAVALTYLYPHRLHDRLFWIADATYTEKPYAQHVASVDWFHRLKYVAGRAKTLKGHRYVFAAHLYTIGEEKRRRWASILVGALLYVKGRSIPTLVGSLAQHLRLPWLEAWPSTCACPRPCATAG
jgi:hypothetical protein